MSGRFSLADYEPVEERLRRFWADHPNGRIVTDLVHRDERQYIVRADVYTDRDDERPAATGYAEEVVGSTPVNKTSALENAETSAVGRCLANLGYAPKGARASREEMEKAARLQAPETSAPVARGRLGADAKANGWSLDIIARLYRDEHDEELAKATDPARIEAFRKGLYARSDSELKAAAS
jgi:hypothetical protein